MFTFSTSHSSRSRKQLFGRRSLIRELGFVPSLTANPITSSSQLTIRWTRNTNIGRQIMEANVKHTLMEVGQKMESDAEDTLTEVG